MYFYYGALGNAHIKKVFFSDRTTKRVGGYPPPPRPLGKNKKKCHGAFRGGGLSGRTTKKIFLSLEDMVMK